MDNDLVVVAGCTHREGFLDEYEQKLHLAGIEFILWPLSNLPAGANSINMRRRIDYIREVCLTYEGYRSLVMTDAWDVLFFGTKEEVLNKVPDTMLVSGERNCYPEPHLTERFTGNSPWRFANNGMIAGNPQFILTWLDWAEQIGDFSILDQAWFNRRILDYPDKISIDEMTDLFYVVSATQEDGALKEKDGRPWNSRYNRFPCFMHFSGKCPDDRFRKLLKNEIESL